MGYYNCLGQYVPDRDETYEYTNGLGQIVRSTPERRGYVRDPRTGRYITRGEYSRRYFDYDDPW